MATVVPIARPAPRPADPTVGELVEQVAVLAGLIIEFAREGDELRRRLAEIEGRLPKPRFTIPPGWVPIKKASGSFALSTVHQWARERKITSMKVGGRRYVDPNSMPPARA